MAIASLLMMCGDAVNVAARMEDTGNPGRIHVTDTFADILRDRFEFEPRGETDIKGKGLDANQFSSRRNDRRVSCGIAFPSARDGRVTLANGLIWNSRIT